MERATTSHVSKTGSRWLVWASVGIFMGLFYAISERLLLGNPGIHGTIAAIFGSVVGILGCNLIRGRGNGSEFAVAWASMPGGLIGAKSGSIILAVVAGVIGSILYAGGSRLIYHFLDGPRKAGGGTLQAADRTFGELERCWDEIEVDTGALRPTRDELHDRS